MSHARRRAFKRFEELIEIEVETEGLGDVNSELSVCVDNSEEFNIQVSDGESDQGLGVEDMEDMVSDDDMFGLGDQCPNGGQFHLIFLSWLLNIKMYHPCLP